MSPVYAADDDSTPYMPYPETPQPAQPAPAPAKKSAPKKKTPAKKSAPKKKTPAKKSAKPKAPARPSSLQRGIALMKEDKYEQAKPYLLKAIQENRNDPNAWYWYGMYHEKTGGFHQAQYFYSKAVTIDPAFEPLSRVVYYPEDSEKTPLWDPKRPARVYPVEAASTGGVASVPAGLPGRSSFPEAPNDPELPHVPVYVPPEPGAAPFDGDAWSPAVYVPPSPEEIQTEGEMSPVYLPPEPQSIIAQDQQTQQQVIQLPMYRYPEGEKIDAETNSVYIADKPVYTPPEPREQAPAQAKQTPAVKKQTQAKTQQVSSKRTASVPSNRVVRQTAKKTNTKKAAPAKAEPPKTQPRRQAASRDVRPQTPARPAQPQTRQRVQEQAAPQSQQQTQQTARPERQERQQEQNYIPPVGQQAPDPGTIPDTPIPPVGQSSQY